MFHCIEASLVWLKIDLAELVISFAKVNGVKK